MPEPVAIYSLSALLHGLGMTLLYLAAGVLLCLVGRWLTKKKPNCPGLLRFAFFALGVAALVVAFFDVPPLIVAAGQLLL